MSIDGLDQNICYIFPLLHYLVKILIVTEADAETLAGVGYDFLISNNSNNLYHFLKEFVILKH
jgi:hypothetical protein